MLKKLLALILCLNFTIAKDITPSDVYTQAMLISEELHVLFDYYDVEHDHDGTVEQHTIKIPLKPRNVWQKSYEIMVKINMLRVSKQLPIVNPVNLEPVLNLSPSLVYEQTQRILTEIKIFKYRMGIKDRKHKVKIYKNKTPVDVYNALAHISASFDELNNIGFIYKIQNLFIHILFHWIWLF